MQIVDALVVTLGLDTSAFKRGKAEASAATKKLTAEELAAAKQIEERNKRAADSFRALRTELLALVGLFAAGLGIKNFAEQTMRGAIATGQFARDLGMVPGQVRAVEQSFDRLGASAADADDAMRGIQEQAAKLKNGEFDDRLQAYLMNASRAGVKGASVRDVDDPIKKLQQDAEIAQKLAQTQGRGYAILAMQQEGYSRAMADALMQGPAALRAEMERQSKLNQLSQDETDRLRQLDNRWKDFKEGIGLTMQRVVIAMTPAFDTIARLLTRLSDWFAAHADQIGAQVQALADRFAAWVTSVDWDQVIASVKRFFEQLDKAVQSLGGWKTVLEALLALKVISMITPLIQLAGALSGVGSALGVIGTLGGGAIAVLAAIFAMLPTTDLSKGLADLRKGDWLAASKDLPAAAFIQALAMKGMGESNDDIARAIQAAGFSDGGAGGKSIAGQAANAMIPSAGAAQMPGGAMGIPQDLARKAGPVAVSAALQTQQKYGVPAAVTLAQYGLESGFGKQMPLGSNNPFGIHARAGQDFVMGYDWDASGNRVPTKFAKYASIAEAFEAHGKLLATGRAYTEARKHQDDPMAYAAALTGTYATDPRYGAKLQAMMGQSAAALSQANALQIARQTAAAALPAPSNSVSNTTNSNEANFTGPIHIHSNAADGAGLARDFVNEVNRRQFQFDVSQANTGMA
ncbi:glycoside hydrolase family 73 protein [Burkholderia vietnamiensis]|uniref:glycoside hydrolase family 73 protein n=1 Tax=Burkholderia vietnamiensis TaxID=60552 RepID=UPI0007549EC9|nr:glucosaminidase domain-containing protein [Burkholderia vietnamiensis]KVS13852.1 hypothetical protein WK29_16270 [Burkholderia vietnamiensis]MCA7985358.1 glucosaminidase domain-containing protein [Burkholderia vietnamiensis]HDR8932813.1 glucosaminidase domain-containing protein [Burkholderia vietnamiensis]